MSKNNSISAEQALDIAKSAAENGDKAKAEKYYHAVLKKYPEHQQAMKGIRNLNPDNLYGSDIDELHQLYYKEEFREVEVKTKMLLEKYEDVPDLLNLAAISLAAQEKFDEASLYFNKIVELNPKSPAGHFNLANVQKTTGDLDNAFKNYKKAIKLKPDYIEAINNLGNLYNVRGQLDEAYDCFVKVAFALPKSREALLNVATVLMAQRKYDEALKHYDRVAKIGDVAGHVIHDMAMCHQYLGNLETAYKFFDGLLKDIPDYFSGHNNFGNLLQQQGDHEKALYHFEQAMSLKPEDATSYHNLGNLYRKMGLLDDSVEMFEKANEILPDTDEILYNYADSLKLKGDYETARDVYEKIFSTNAQGPVCITSLAILNFLLADDVQAQKYIDMLDAKFLASIENVGVRTFCATYKNYFTDLFKINKKYDRNLKDDVEKLWIIGPSGSLSFKGHNVTLDGCELVCDSKLITGATASHLSNGEDNKFKSSIKSNLSELVEDSNILFMFGATDFQLADGKISDDMAAMVGAYFDNTYNIAREEKVIASYCAVAAPVIDDDAVGADDLILRIKQFNGELKELCQKNDLTFVDLYSLTVTENDRADGSKHLADKFHLMPTVIKDALAL